MTALTSGQAGPSSLSALPCINHRCLRRKSLRTYELADPARPGAELSYDVGQVKKIVQMDKRLREEGIVAPVPAGFHEFATCFNQYAVGPERFATYNFIRGKAVIHKGGSPIVWEHFKIDDWLVGWNRDPSNQDISASAASTSAMNQPSQIPLPLFDIAENTVDPKLKDLSGRMRVAIQTTDELTKFWIKRGAIEHQYASRLANLAETMIGESDSSQLRRAIDALRMETAQQAMKRHDLANQIAVDLESRCVELQMKQRTHWRDIYEPAARKLHHDQVRSARRRSGGVASEWKQEYKKLRYSLDTRRLQSMKANLDFSNNAANGFSSPLTESSPDSPVVASGPAYEWEMLRNSCLQLEMERCQFMEESLAAFLETLSVVSDTDRSSISFITQWKDLFMPRDFIEEFAQRFGGSKPLPASTGSYGKPPLTPLRGPPPPNSSLNPNQSTSSGKAKVSFESSRALPKPPGPLARVNESLQSTDTGPSLSRSSSTRERPQRTLGGFGLTISGRSTHTRTQSQHKTPALLPLSSDPRPRSPSRPTLSKFANVFQRSNFSRNERNDYAS